MAWMDPQWAERDRQYREKVKAEGRPLPPDTPANRSATRVALYFAAIAWAALIIALVVFLTAR